MPADSERMMRARYAGRLESWFAITSMHEMQTVPHF